VQTRGTWTYGRAKETESWPLNKETDKSGPSSTLLSLKWRQSHLLLPLWTEPGLYLLPSVFRLKKRLEKRASRIVSGEEGKDAKENSKNFRKAHVPATSTWEKTLCESTAQVHMHHALSSPNQGSRRFLKIIPIYSKKYQHRMSKASRFIQLLISVLHKLR
jgi:hypothetical protein